MNELLTNFTILKFLSYHFTTARFLYRSLCLLLLAGFIGTAAAADAPRAQVASLGPGLPFSVADFDGDSRPDLASVQAGKSDSLRSDYWIQLQLSANGRQTFRIVAPLGGLQIVSRDVNGDNAPDLVLTTAWLGQPVAILLNDGHGNFSQVEPTAFPDAFSGCSSSWNLPSGYAADAAGVPLQFREDVCSRTEPTSYLGALSLLAAASDSPFSIGPFLISHAGRAPPFEVPHF